MVPHIDIPILLSHSCDTWFHSQSLRFHTPMPVIPLYIWTLCPGFHTSISVCWRANEAILGWGRGDVSYYVDERTRTTSNNSSSWGYMYMLTLTLLGTPLTHSQTHTHTHTRTDFHPHTHTHWHSGKWAQRETPTSACSIHLESGQVHLARQWWRSPHTHTRRTYTRSLSLAFLSVYETSCEALKHLPTGQCQISQCLLATNHLPHRVHTL